VSEPELELHYALHELPAGRFPFRRWRFELWHGPRLLATGWRTTEAHAERALRERAARFASRLRGLHLLRPEHAQASAPLRLGAVARVTCGAVSVRLVPRRLLADAA
jgi:hypothetical protein